MPALDRDAVLQALRGVIDPDLNQDIVTLGFVTHCEVDGGKVTVTINLTTPACPVKDQLKGQAEGLIRALPGVTHVAVEMTAEVRGSAGPARDVAKDIRHVVAISSGKGGVGKSTVSVNLACALAKTGARVGLLDCDVHGPDIPLMMGLDGQPEQIQVDGATKLVPKEQHGVLTMSIGYLLPAAEPIIWRGPMVHSFVRQMLADVAWGPLDYLLVDMPPGTGDAQLSLAQQVPLTGAVLVTTPQAVAAYDVTKAIAMFRKVDVPILGIVENMSGYTIEGLLEGGANAAGASVRLAMGGTETVLPIDAEGRFRTVVDLFGKGGGKKLAQLHGFPFLGEVPIDPDIRTGGDTGAPIVVSSPDRASAEALLAIAGKVAQRIAVRSFASLPILD